MAGRIIPAKGDVLTGNGTADGYITIASNVGYYVGAHGFLKGATAASREVTVTELKSTNQLGIRFVRAMGTGVNYGRDDVSAYTVADSARIDTEEQFIFNRNDKPLD
jgi:hypothetical protein